MPSLVSGANRLAVDPIILAIPCFILAVGALRLAARPNLAKRHRRGIALSIALATAQVVLLSLYVSKVFSPALLDLAAVALDVGALVVLQGLTVARHE